MRLDKNAKSSKFKRVFLETEEGKYVLGEIYKMCGANRQIFVPNDSHATAFSSGQHRVMQGIMSMLAHDEADALEVYNKTKI